MQTMFWTCASGSGLILEHCRRGNVSFEPIPVTTTFKNDVLPLQISPDSDSLHSITSSTRKPVDLHLNRSK